MDTTIIIPASCELSGMILFFCLLVCMQAKELMVGEIPRRFCLVYGDDVVSDISARDWCRKFRDGGTDVHDKERH